MRPIAFLLLIVALGIGTPARAQTPLTLEVIGDKGEVVETLVVAPDQIADVQSGFDQAGRPVLTIRFGEAVRAKLGEMTKRNVYKLMRMRVGDTVLTPGARIMSPIMGGSVQLTGFDPKDIDKIKKQLARP